MSRKSPAQILFQRIVRTWISPEAVRRAKGHPGQGPILLRLALIVWDKRGDEPSVYFNQETFGRVETVKFVAAGKVCSGQPVGPENIKGIRSVRLAKQHWGQTYIFVCQGVDELYYVTFDKIGALKEFEEFQLLKDALETEGVRLTVGENLLPMAIDLVRNSYVGSATTKRRLTLELKRARIEQEMQAATDKVRRYLKLPAYIIYQDDEVLPLLLEARESYIDGHFFSCIAASVTAADRICNGLLERYGVDRNTRRKLLEENTLGQKIPQLRRRKLIGAAQQETLESLNILRKKHLHPKYAVGGRTMRRDAFSALTLLHKFLEGTLSVFRDYAIENGRLVPRPLA